MLNSLYGTITAKQPQSIYLDTGGMEWDISVSDTTLDLLPRAGEKARVYTWLLHREDSMRLFGFASPQERSLFLDLLRVDGVGTRGALKIMSGISGEQLEQALDSGDLSRLERLPGVGKKTAQKMLLALKGRLAFSTSADKGAGRQSPLQQKWQDVAAALSDMGYDRRACEETLSRLEQQLSQELDGKSRAEQEEIMFRRAIVELA